MMPDVINITEAKQIGDYQIFLRFDDESAWQFRKNEDAHCY